MQDDPYTRLAAHYDRLVDWVVAEQGETPRTRMADFLQAHWAARETPVREVLEVCCGTGLMVEELTRRGYPVTGLDRSAAMLEQARNRLDGRAELLRAELPRIPAELSRGFDAVLSVGAGFTYLPEDGLTETLASVARVLRPNGSFVFDLLGPGFFEQLFTPSSPRVMAVELEDVSYIWTFTAPSSGAHHDMLYTQFVRREDGDGRHDTTYTRSRDLHRFYTVGREDVRRAAVGAGFTGIEVFDNYTWDPAGPGTRYETWTMTLA